MADSRKPEFVDDQNDISNGGTISEVSLTDSRPESSSFVEDTAVESIRVENEYESTGVVDNVVNGGDEFFLGEDMVLRWLQALDMQVLGACRADERLKPLLKLNVSNGMAEDCLLAHLSQHFEPAEIGMLARCFCLPLVSIRVGKIKKEGTRMCPTTTRGNLSLVLLPTSELRLSFIGDNGHSEKLFTYSSDSQCSLVSIEDVTADTSGRSFVIRIPDGCAFYYWCSEKSRLLGIELRRKMKDLIGKKPSISELTGIDESRLGCVTSHLSLYLLGSVVPNSKGCPTHVSSSSSSTASSKSPPIHYSGCRPTKTSSSHQGSLSPRSTSFKETTTTLKNSSSLRNSCKDKSKRSSDSHVLPVSSLTATETSFEMQKEGAGDHTKHLQKLPWEMGPPILSSPYYCWCPPVITTTSSLHSPASSQHFPSLSLGLSPLPPLPSLLPPPFELDGLLNPPTQLDVSQIPPLLPDSLSLVRLPISSSQQIPTFTPLMCDPIVHIPVIDVCSSGQGYLVSAGPGIPTSVMPPLHHHHPNNDSLLEKGARETLRLLLSGGGAAAETGTAEDGPGLLVAGTRRGLYNGSRDVGVTLFAPLGLQPSVVVVASGRAPGANAEAEDGRASGESNPSMESSG